MLLWCAYGISAMGDHLSEMAILKTQHAASPDVDVTPLDARMTFLFFLPFFLFAPITGWLADRLPRRGVMITADLVRCAMMFSFTALMAWTSPWGSWGPFLPLMVVGAFAGLFSPARSALLPTLVRPNQLVRANGMISGLGVIGTMIAIQIGGHLAEYYAAGLAFRIDALTYLASAVFLWVMRPPRQTLRSGREVGVRVAASELADGFRYVWCHRRVRELLAVATLIWFCGPLVKCVTPAIVRDVYGGSYQAMSGYRALMGLGFILGAAGVATLGDPLRSEIAITWGLLGAAVSTATFGLSTFLPLQAETLATIGGVGVVGAGAFGVTVMAGFNALLQRIVPDRYRGRIFGVNNVCTTGALLIATSTLGLPQGTRVDRLVGHILVGAAAVLFVAGLVTLRVRLKRSIHRPLVAFLEHLNEFLARFWWRFQRVGPATVPREGAVIIASNHRCSADPLFLLAAVPYRPFAFMVAEEFTHWPVIRSLMNLIECIPVRRSAQDTGATKLAIRHLRAGKAIGIFIEGRIVQPGERVEPKDGVAMLALRTGALVIPAHIRGAKPARGILRGLLARHRIRVRFGRPVDLREFKGDKPNRVAVRRATRKIFAAIQSLETAPASPETGDLPRTGLEAST